MMRAAEGEGGPAVMMLVGVGVAQRDRDIIDDLIIDFD